MKAAKAIIECLKNEKVNIIFGYPGGAVLPLYEALRQSNLKHILVRNEQSLVHYASGYYRETGQVGVCIATSGPGATNTITGIATAYMDSIPVVVITGQVNTELIGTDAFQEVDIVGATQPFTKHNYLIKNAEDIPRIFREAFYIANSGRKGPVLIDIPRNIQEEDIFFQEYDRVHIIGYQPTLIGNKRQIKRAIDKIKEAKRPIIYAGGGILSANAQKELLTFAEKTKIPVINSLMGIGSFPHDHPLYAGIVGSHGYIYSNKIIEKTDLLIVIGARMADRATGRFKELNPRMEYIHIDIDPAEIGKNIDAMIPIVGDAKRILKDLIQKNISIDTFSWLEEIEKIKQIYPINIKMQSGCFFINPKELIITLSDTLEDSACLVADVGQNQIWAALYYRIVGQRNYFTSGGLGTMGYSLPAAIGVKIGNPNRQVICIMGDGSFQMCLGELAVVREQNIGIKIIVFNNNKLGMVKGLQDDFYGKGHNFGVDLNDPVDFIKIAQAYSIKAYRVEKMDTFKKVWNKVLKEEEPCLIQCLIDPEYTRF
ncbi:biosynthetic-type acetolactate synthase large subunit [Garciella nitratireducens]|uniref:Acetolactate synthase n=1 Tax=Garciella nitratireducens DSM 15102 TaxID=1121911 RepID=A0A1T4N0U4_9FIRM|nr:biosynthetic-type acetolactate synthase large subunit [Garciella nitratireducens]RBP42721.1 acetolactate synthase large subunit [Garciella nitratireducens]SJZ72744.1 acetolactate synthase, large subunit [Garciella nitratireducens DSM 15102]